MIFDKAYFDGKLVNNPNPAGYGCYKLSAYSDESAYQRATILRAQLGYDAKNILILGCAYGFLVEELVKSGRNAFGLDISEYALSQASVDVSAKLVLGDASKQADYTAVLQLAGIEKFDAIVSENMLCCLTDLEIKALNLITKEVATRVVHLVSEAENLSQWYNYKSIKEYNSFLPGNGARWYSLITWSLS